MIQTHVVIMITDTASFGGDWTEQKLDALRAYLNEYMKIFTKNLWARHYRTVYFDGFAGYGQRVLPHRSRSEEGSLFSEETDIRSIDRYRAGSPRIALEISPPFGRYIFNDTDPSAAESLSRLRADYPLLADRIEVSSLDANEALLSFCAKTDWSVTRAVVFLDPYGMQVNWATIEQIALTEAIDMWLLFPIGQAVARLLTNDELPPRGWSRALTRTLGTDEWREAFYGSPDTDQGELFEKRPGLRRIADLEDIARYFNDRLKGIFKGVPEKPMFLRNTRGLQLFLLCFAAGNERGAVPAVKIASHLLERR